MAPLGALARGLRREGNGWEPSLTKCNCHNRRVDFLHDKEDDKEDIHVDGCIRDSRNTYYDEYER